MRKLTVLGSLGSILAGILWMIPAAVAQDDAAAAGALAALCGGFILIPIILFIVSILLAVWVYKDAEKRGMGGVLWLIVVIITGIIGLIIYLIVRADHPAKTQ